MQLENLNNDKLRYVARMPRIPTPYACYINLHARVRINSSRYTIYDLSIRLSQVRPPRKKVCGIRDQQFFFLRDQASGCTMMCEGQEPKE